MAGIFGYGVAKGLSERHDFGKDIDRLYQREAYRSQVEAEKAQKTRYYASQMKEHAAVAPSMIKELEGKYEKLNNKIADFATNNPGWETDVSKTQEFNSITDEYLNNEFVRKDIQSQEQFKLLQDNYNAGNLTETEWLRESERYNDFAENGGNGYVYSNPKRKEMPSILKEVNDFLQPDVLVRSDGKKITQTSDIPPEELHAATRLWYKNPENKMTIDNAFNELNEDEKAVYNNSPTDYFEQLIKAGESSQDIDKGYDALYMAGIKANLENKGKGGYHMYSKSQIIEPLARGEATISDPKNIVFTEYGEEGGYIAMGPGGRSFKTYDPNGKVIDLNINGQSYAISGGKIKNIGGVPYEEVQIGVMANPGQLIPEDQFLDKGELWDENTYRETHTRSETKNKKEQLAQEKAIAKTKQIELSKRLIDAGFIVNKATEEGMVNINLSGSKTVGDIYVGTVLMPANLSEGNRIRYDQSYQTNTNLSKFAGDYNERNFINEQIQANNTPIISSDINRKFGESISLQAGKNVGNLSWKRDQNDPFIWTSKDNEGYYYKFDYKTNTYQVAKPKK